MIHVGDFPVTSRRLPRNIPVTRVTVMFRGSRRIGIWALALTELDRQTHFQLFVHFELKKNMYLSLNFARIFVCSKAVIYKL